jgi:hypothetical protein
MPLPIRRSEELFNNGEQNLTVVAFDTEPITFSISTGVLWHLDELKKWWSRPWDRRSPSGLLMKEMPPLSKDEVLRIADAMIRFANNGAANEHDR